MVVRQFYRDSYSHAQLSPRDRGFTEDLNIKLIMHLYNDGKLKLIRENLKSDDIVRY